MAVLGSGSSNNDAQTWQVDYDDASTVGLTCAGTGTLVISVTITSTGQTFSLDATPFLNQGRVVLGGPGSVLGFTAAIPPAAIPTPVRGQVPPFEFSTSSSPLLKRIAGAAIHDGGAALIRHVVRAIEQTLAAREEAISGTKAALDAALAGLYGAVIASVFES